MTDGLEVVRRAFEAWAARDIDALLALASPEVEWRPSAFTAQAPVYRGHEGVLQWVGGLERIALEIEFELCEARAAGDRFLVLAVVHEGEPGGPRIDNRVGWVCDVAGGLVTRAEGFASWERARAAAEAVPPAPRLSAR